MKMRIIIENLEFYSIIGVYKRERKNKQKLIIDAYIDYEFKDKYLDYAEVADFIEEYITSNKFHSIELALINLSKSLKEKYENILKVKLRLKKPTILPNADVGVEFSDSF